MADNGSKTNSTPTHFKRILIARGGAIGDFILTLPVFQALKASFPHATLGCLSPAGRGEIAQMAGLTDEIRNVDDRCWASFFVKNGELDGGVCNWLSSFDCIISYFMYIFGINFRIGICAGKNNWIYRHTFYHCFC